MAVAATALKILLLFSKRKSRVRDYQCQWLGFRQWGQNLFRLRYKAVTSWELQDTVSLDDILGKQVEKEKN